MSCFVYAHTGWDQTSPRSSKASHLFAILLLASIHTLPLCDLLRVGPDSPEIIQGIAIAVKGLATKKQFDSTVGVHPSGTVQRVSVLCLCACKKDGCFASVPNLLMCFSGNELSGSRCT